jgi:hypothetical protein
MVVGVGNIYVSWAIYRHRARIIKHYSLWVNYTFLCTYPSSSRTRDGTNNPSWFGYLTDAIVTFVSDVYIPVDVHVYTYWHMQLGVDS